MKKFASRINKRQAGRHERQGRQGQKAEREILTKDRFKPIGDSKESEYTFTKVPNAVLDALPHIRISGQEWQLIFVVWRKTWGFHKRRDEIAQKQFIKLTGINRCKTHKLLKGLTDKKILIKSVAQKDNKKITTYRFNENYHEWILLPKKVTRVKMQSVTQRGSDSLPKEVTDLLPKRVVTKETIKESTKERNGGINPAPQEGMVSPPFYWQGIIYHDGCSHEYFTFADNIDEARTILARMVLDELGLSRHQLERALFPVIQATQPKAVEQDLTTQPISTDVVVNITKGY